MVRAPVEDEVALVAEATWRFPPEICNPVVRLTGVLKLMVPLAEPEIEGVLPLPKVIPEVWLRVRFPGI